METSKGDIAVVEPLVLKWGDVVNHHRNDCTVFICDDCYKTVKCKLVPERRTIRSEST